MQKNTILWDWSGTLVRNCAPTPGAIACLSKWKGATHAIVTNGSTQLTQSEVESLGWTKYFELIQGGEHAQKPHPEAIFYVLKLLGKKPGKNVIMIGDQKTDIECARRAGCFGLLVTPGDLQKLAELDQEELFHRLDYHDRNRNSL